MKSSVLCLLLCASLACSPEGAGVADPSGAEAALAPEPALAGDDLARVLLAERALMEDRPEEVAAILAPLLARERPPAKALFDLAWADYNLQRYGECIDGMQRAVAQDPELAGLDRVSGFSHYKLGHYDEAGTIFETVIAARPDDHRSLYGLGQVLLTTGQLERAAELLERALAIEPTYIKAQFALGRVVFEQGDPVAALPLVASVVERQPSHEEAIYVLSQVLASLGLTDDAQAATERWQQVYAARDRIGALDRAVRAGPSSAELHLAMADEFLVIGDPLEARRVLQDALRRHPGDGSLLAALSRIEAGER